MLLKVLEHKIKWNRLQVCMKYRSKVFMSFIKRKNYVSVKYAIFFLLIRCPLSLFLSHNQCTFQDLAQMPSLQWRIILLHIPSTSILFVWPFKRQLQLILLLLSVVSILLEYKFLQGHTYKCAKTYLLHFYIFLSFSTGDNALNTAVSKYLLIYL